jgi:exonuclease VII large subunit
MGERLTMHVTRQLRIDRERLRGMSRHPILADPEASINRGRERLSAEIRHLVAGTRATLQESRSRLDRLAARLERHRPAHVYATRDSRLQLAMARLEAVMAVRLARADVEPPAAKLRSVMLALLERRNSDLQSAARGLDLIGPHGVLRRGYSMTLRPDGQIIRSTSDVSAGVTVTTRLSDGAFDSRVLGAGAPATGIEIMSTRGARSAAVTTRPRRAVHNPDQMDLFGPPR